MMFFLMCSERSGSNFITKLLNGHKNICGPSAKHIINPLARNLFRYKDLNKVNNWNELLKDVHRLLNVNFSLWKKEFSLKELEEIAQLGDVKSLINNIYMEEAKANGKEHVFIKENHVYEFLPFLLLNFPKSKYVYQTRDPRDMALSWKKSLEHPGGIIQAAKQWQKDQQNTLKNHYELEKRGLSYFVKYEDLIEDTNKYITKVVEFLGMPKDENIENFYKDALTIENAKMYKGWNNLSKRILKNNKNKYVKELNQDEIKAIEKICYLEMEYLGYKTEYSIAVLEKFSEEKINDMQKYEMENIPYSKSKRVRINSEAKKIFYKKCI